ENRRNAVRSGWSGGRRAARVRRVAEAGLGICGSCLLSPPGYLLLLLLTWFFGGPSGLRAEQRFHFLFIAPRLKIAESSRKPERLSAGMPVAHGYGQPGEVPSCGLSIGTCLIRSHRCGFLLRHS